jgi:hypothetical protein
LSPNADGGGGEGCGISANEYNCACTWSPNKLWISNSIPMPEIIALSIPLSTYLLNIFVHYLPFFLYPTFFSNKKALNELKNNNAEKINLNNLFRIFFL